MIQLDLRMYLHFFCFFKGFFNCLNFVEATHICLLIGTSFASFTRNHESTLINIFKKYHLYLVYCIRVVSMLWVEMLLRNRLISICYLIILIRFNNILIWFSFNLKCIWHISNGLRQFLICYRLTLCRLWPIFILFSLISIWYGLILI